jgi:hypothetical protein
VAEATDAVASSAAIVRITIAALVVPFFGASIDAPPVMDPALRIAMRSVAM